MGTYGLQKLNEIIPEMAVSLDRLQVRLLYAFMSMPAVQEKDFPEGEAQDRWRSIYARATAETTFDGTLLNLNDKDALRLARDIVDLWSLLT